MILVLDWRNYIKHMSHSILSGSIACSYPTEAGEIQHRVMKGIYCIRLEYPDAKLCIANDIRPYWRHKYLLDFYNKRGEEPVEYKGNRAKQTWPFKTEPADMEIFYANLLKMVARSTGAIVLQDRGLEADDIWGILCATHEGQVMGYSRDSDWAQCIKTDGRISIYNFVTDELVTTPADIRIKWVAGDRGDNVMGCGKMKKDGTPAKNGWGKDKAEQVIQEYDPYRTRTDSEFIEWFATSYGVDKDILEKNRMVTTLPCPAWNPEEAAQALAELAEVYEATDEYWDRAGVTANVRKILEAKAERDAFLSRLRFHIQTMEA